jgi:hypothetical protein
VKLERELELWPVLAASGVLALGLAVAPGAPLRALGFTIVAGLPPLLALRSRWSGLELLAVAPAASLLVFAVLGAALGPRSALVSFVPALLALALAAYAARVPRRLTLRLAWADGAALLAAAIFAFSLASVFRRNGLHGADYLARSWFGRDTFYLFSIAEEAVQRNGYPSDNPFLAGVANYYPSLAHVGLGTLATQSGLPVAIGSLWPLPFLFVMSPVLCLLAALSTVQGPGWLAALSVLLGLAGAVALRPDLLVYPHTQALCMSWLFLLRWLWGGTPGLAERLAAFAVGVALVFAHSVTGATAVALLFGLCLAELGSANTRRAGACSTLGVLLLALLLLKINRLPHPGARMPLSEVSLSGLAAFLDAWRLPLLGLFGLLCASFRKPLAALPVLGVVSLGLLYYGYGSTLRDGGERWFVYFNAERFLHLGLLLALPLAASGARWLSLASVLLVLGAATLRPTQLASDTRSLVRAPALVVDPTDLAWFERIRRETPADARFLTNLGSYALPAFTGRAQNPIEGNLWGNNTLPSSEFNSRWSDAASFFQSSQADKRAVLERWGYSHVLARRAGSARQVRSLVKQLGRAGFAVFAEDERYLLFARAAPR